MCRSGSGCWGGTRRSRTLFPLVALAIASTDVVAGQQTGAAPVLEAQGVMYEQEGLLPGDPYFDSAEPLGHHGGPFSAPGDREQEIKSYQKQGQPEAPVGLDASLSPNEAEIAGMKPPKVKLRGLFTLAIGLLLAASLARGGYPLPVVGACLSFAAMGLIELVYSIHMRRRKAQQFDLAKFLVMNAEDGKRRNIISSNLTRPQAPVKPVASYLTGYLALLVLFLVVSTASIILTNATGLFVVFLMACATFLPGAILSTVLQKTKYFFERMAWKKKLRQYEAKSKGKS